MSEGVDAPPAAKRRVSAHVVVGVAAAVALLSTFMTWASVYIASVSGIRTGDGKLVLGLAVAGLALFAAHRAGRVGRRWFGVVEAVLGVLIAIVTIVDIVDLGDRADAGIYLAFAAGVVWAGAAVASLRATRTP